MKDDVKAGAIRQSYGDVYSAKQFVIDTTRYMGQCLLKYHNYCAERLLYNAAIYFFIMSCDDNAITTVRKWAAEHPNTKNQPDGAGNIAD